MVGLYINETKQKKGVKKNNGYRINGKVSKKKQLFFFLSFFKIVTN